MNPQLRIQICPEHLLLEEAKIINLEISLEMNLFREELTQIINHRHPLFIFAEQID